MAQFDVHRNTGKNQDAIPFIVRVQSALFDDYRRSVVIPLVRKSSLGVISDERFNPIFKIKRIEVVLHPLEIVSVPNEKLGEFVISIAGEGSRITDALDVLLSRAWG